MIVHHRINRALYAFKPNIKLQFTCLTLSDPYSDKQMRVYPTCCPLVPKGASKMLLATGHARMVNEGARGVQQFKNDHDARPR